jgi:signal transduction histidine kinase
MSWVTAIWVLVASACLTLSVMHLMIGLRQRHSSNVLFAVTSLAVVAIAAFELALMHSRTPEAYGSLVQWIHVPIWVLYVTVILLVRTSLKAGRPWLAGATILARSTALVINFAVSPNPNLNYTEITGLRQVPLFGERVSVAVGTISEWTRLGQLSSVFLLVFLLDATWTVWRRGERTRAMLVGGSMSAFVLLAAGHTALVHAGILKAPYVISLCFLGVIGAMSYDLASDILRANELAYTVRRQEEVLHETDRRLGLAADSADLGFWSWDSLTGRLWMSPRARAMRGYAPEERLDIERFMATVHPEDREALRRKVHDAALRGGPFELEYRIVPPNSDTRWVAMRGAGELYGTSGAHVRGVSIDITLRKQAEAEAREREIELAHLSRVTMLGELSGTLAHELNQPLTAILSNAQAALRLMADNRESREEIQEILAEIVAEDKRAGEVILRMRALLKKGEFRPEAVAVPHLIDEALRLLHGDLLSHGVSVSKEIGERLPQVQADRVQIVQVLMNLFTNACDAMDHRGPEERRLLLGAGRENGFIRVSVRDTGSGIPQASLERLFEPFVSGKTKGMGLGLTICRTIVTAHGGRIWATNNEDRGAALNFTLPVSGDRAS